MVGVVWRHLENETVVVNILTVVTGVVVEVCRQGLDSVDSGRSFMFLGSGR